MNDNLGLLKKYQKEIALLTQTSALLDWDQQTYMPENGIASKAEQSALLNTLIHERVTSNELFTAIKKLKKVKISGDVKIMIDKLFRKITKRRKLPKKFVEELSRETSLAFSSWVKAKIKSDFSIFRPHLEKIVKLKRKQAHYFNLPGHLYNGLLDDFEEGMTVEKLIPAFEHLKNHLLQLIKKIESSPIFKNQKLKLLQKKYPGELQIEFCHDVVKRIGLNSVVSRLDFAEHPFTTSIGIDDVRITTNIRTNSLFAFESSIHEAGHALYVLGLPRKYAYTILSDAPSFGLHESQSRFWENMISRNKPFWKYYFPKFNKTYELHGDIESWYREINSVTPGKIRVEADEVHYCLHIILRFEIELRLLEDTIKAKDLPEIWNGKMKELFGVAPENDKEGVLQDVHWSGGAFGYFPTYALGTIYAAQLYNALRKDLPAIEKDIEKGNYSKIKEWLSVKVHRHGAKYLAEEIMKKVCGEGLNPDAYINYLTTKYGEIYNF